MTYRIKKIQEKAPLKKNKKHYFWFRSTKAQKKSAVFQNNMIDVAYYSFNAFVQNQVN